MLNDATYFLDLAGTGLDLAGASVAARVGGFTLCDA
jgi:hypothetical protein